MNAHEPATPIPPANQPVRAAGPASPPAPGGAVVTAPPRYWKSLEERAGDPAVLAAAQDEFPAPPNAAPQTTAAGIGGDRRDFLKVTGFLLAGGLFGGFIRSRVEKAVPYQVLPEHSVPGRSYHYAGMCGACSAGCGLLVKVRDGRPIKLEGNPEHPLNRGGLCAVGQASILGLYDSKRTLKPAINGTPGAWSAVDAALQPQWAALQAGGAVRILTGSQTGPSLQKEIAAFLNQFADGRHIQYDSLSGAAILDAHAATHGARLLPHYRFDRADVVVSFDADFLGTWIAPVEFSKGYAARRAPGGGQSAALLMCHHTQFEARLSLTGARADDRHLLHPGELTAALGQLAVRLSNKAGLALPFTPAATAIDAAVWDGLAARLWAARSRSLVVCGTNDLAAQLLVNVINAALNNYGATLDVEQPSLQRQGDDQAVMALLAEMEAGQVQALIVAGVNPVYDLPDGERFAKALEKVALTIGCSDHADETASRTQYHCPEPHWLEAWRDAESVAGIVTLAQPAIRRIGQTRTLLESLAVWRGAPANNYALVQTAWRELVFPRSLSAGDFSVFWDQAVQQGFARLSPPPAAAQPFKVPAIPTAAAAAGGLQVVTYATVGLLDGREAENPWLQELADPITKTTWEQCASIAPALAEKLGVRDGDKLRIAANGATVEIPAVIQPGMHPEVVAVPLGYGRKGTERFATVGPQWISGQPTLQPNQRLGQPAAGLTKTADGARVNSAAATVTATGEHRDLARTQQHHSLKAPESIVGPNSAARPIVRERSLAAVHALVVPGAAANPPAADHAAAETPAAAGHAAQGKPGGHGQHEGPEPSLWPADHPYEGIKWGMAIDLSRCTGCSGCVIACQVENNIPVVGWDEVRRSREMHWIRIDRYYSDRADGGVDVVQQPMLCQHCDHAPCEVVCPVLATVHSSEGINQQVYNRCIGTRYCANNCPYKVRRFNWFAYAHNDARENLVFNPDVTVRSSGVMEKCSFCIQRIQETKAEAQRAGRPLQDGDVKTACEQSCAADAIVFGNLNDPESAVARLVRDQRAYKVLEDIGTRPAISYLEVVRNRTE